MLSGSRFWSHALSLWGWKGQMAGSWFQDPNAAEVCVYIYIYVYISTKEKLNNAKTGLSAEGNNDSKKGNKSSKGQMVPFSHGRLPPKSLLTLLFGSGGLKGWHCTGRRLRTFAREISFGALYKSRPQQKWRRDSTVLWRILFWDRRVSILEV